MQLSNYLFFVDTCEQALTFYRASGLGQITEIIRHGELGPSAHEAMTGLIMHARFEGPGILFYASDNHDAEPMRGSAHILMMSDALAAEEIFYRLSEGGHITTPFGVQPWAARFGKVTDRYGVQWMINCTGRTSQPN